MELWNASKRRSASDEYREHIYSRTSMARTFLGSLKFVLDMGSSSHWELIIAKEANGDNLGMAFRSSIKWYFEYTHYNCIDEMILMSTHSIHFHCKIKKKKSLKYPKTCFLELRKNFLVTHKRGRISHGKETIGVQVLLYFFLIFIYLFS